jgi:hypothetical protein
MEKKTKITAIAAMAILTIIAGVYLSLPVAYAVATPMENGQYTISLQYRRRARLGLRFIRNGVPHTLAGEASAVGNSILVLEVGEGQVNVILPPKWILDGQVISTRDLFDGEPLSIGQDQEISLQTLKLELVKNTHTITAYVAYEMQAEGIVIKALTPVNIETN